MKRGSSRRLIALPIRRSAVAAMTPSLLPGGHLLGRPLDRLDDVVVAGAPAEVAFQLVTDLLLARRRVALQHLAGGHDHARRAEAALQTVLLPEALLDGMQLTVLGQALDRGDLGAVGLHGEQGARLHRLAVHEDGAGAALAGVAADVGACQPDRLADVVDEQQARLHFVTLRLAIDRRLDWEFHARPPDRRLGGGTPCGDEAYARQAVTVNANSARSEATSLAAPAGRRRAPGRAPRAPAGPSRGRCARRRRTPA